MYDLIHKNLNLKIILVEKVKLLLEMIFSGLVAQGYSVLKFINLKLRNTQNLTIMLT